MRHLVIAFLSVGLLGCQPSEPAMPSVPVEQVRADLQVISNARVFFGHQSVGRDLLKAVDALARESGVALPITELNAGKRIEGKGLFHAVVGRNGDPASKLADFMASVSKGEDAFDLALLKFCYVDLDDGSKELSPAKIFEHYQRDIGRLRAAQPELAVLHATMPLMSDPPGWKTTVKRWLGRPTWRDDAHRRRAAYNEQLRAHVPEEALFDIARLESTRSDGEQSVFDAGGKRIETMVLDYTYDGGHLNEPANRRIAAEFIHSMAEALRRSQRE